MRCKIRRRHNIHRKEIARKFYDFYALNELWFKLGDGQEAYGYTPTTFVSSHKTDRIKKAFVPLVFELGEAALDALERSLRSEAKYVFGHYHSKGCGTDDFSRYEFSKKFKIPLSISHVKAPMHFIKEAFRHKQMWNNGYGGKNWAKGVDGYFGLREALKGNNITKIIPAIDNVFDLMHNNGFMLNKTEFYVLEDELDTRRDANTPFDYFDGCSDKVKKLLLANKQHFPNTKKEKYAIVH